MLVLCKACNYGYLLGFSQVEVLAEMSRILNIRDTALEIK